LDWKADNSLSRNHGKYKRLRDITTFFLVGVLFFLLFQFYLVILLPIPLTFLILRRGKIRWAIVLVSLAGTLSLIMQPETNIIFYALVVSGYLSFIFAELFERGISTEKIVFFSSGAICILVLFFLGIYFVKSGHRLDQIIRDKIRQSIGEVIASYEEKGMQSDHLAWLKDSSQQIEDSLVNTLPAILVIFLISVVFIDYLLLRRWLQYLEFPVEDQRPFWQWLLSDYGVWLFVLSGLVWYFKKPIPSWISLNFLIIISYLYLVQGVAILIYFFQKGRIPLFFRYLGFFCIFLIPGSYIFLTCGGLFDTWFDFRKLRIKTKETAA